MYKPEPITPPWTPKGQGASSGAGTSGYSGFPGNDGENGDSGYSGKSGVGTSGYSGLSGIGTSGYSGIGTSGYSGIGTSGYSGIGTSGYSGIGTSGYSGIGTSGYSGIGTSGYSGKSGTTGGSPVLLRVLGNNVVISNPDAKTTSSITYVKLKEIIINDTDALTGGALHVKFNLYSDGTGGHSGFGRVYYKGNAKSSEYVTILQEPGLACDYSFTQNLTAGDTIEIWGHRYNTSSFQIGIETMTLEYSWSIKQFGSSTLVTALPVTDTTAISTTNNDP